MMKNFCRALALLALLAALPTTAAAQISITSVDLGRRTDPAVGDATGTLNSHARYLAKALADMWEGVTAHALKVKLVKTDGSDVSYLTDPVAATATAADECVVLSAASTNATSCKASGGNLYGFELYNTTTTVYYMRLYNLAAAPTCSSATGFVRSIPVPPASAAGQVGGVVRVTLIPKNFATGIAYCITAGSSSTDNNNAAVGLFGVLVTK